MKPIAQTVLTNGRLWLVVNGVHVAMQGEKCRDPAVLERAAWLDLSNHFGCELEIWEEDTIKAAALMINEQSARDGRGAT